MKIKWKSLGRSEMGDGLVITLEREHTRLLLASKFKDQKSTFYHALMSKGYSQIYRAPNGLKAVKLAKQHRPHIVLMDTPMLYLFGYEACREIKQALGKDEVVVVGMYGSPTKESPYVESWVRAGADSVLWKPEVLYGADGHGIPKVNSLNLGNIGAFLDKVIKEELGKHRTTLL